jgi:hypothetical protein
VSKEKKNTNFLVLCKNLKGARILKKKKMKSITHETHINIFFQGRQTEYISFIQNSLYNRGVENVFKKTKGKREKTHNKTKVMGGIFSYSYPLDDDNTKMEIHFSRKK